MSDNKYTCAMCRQTYTKEITDEEAMQETQQYFPETKQEECGVVCDDCWQRIRPDKGGLAIGDRVSIKYYQLGQGFLPQETQIKATVLQVDYPFSFMVKYDHPLEEYGEYRSYPFNAISESVWII